MSASPVTAVIVSYYTGPVLCDCLKALGDQAVSEIVVVDNGNPEGAVEEAVEPVKEKVRILTGHGNIGFAAACNLGAGAASGDYLLFLNPDAIMAAGGGRASHCRFTGLAQALVDGRVAAGTGRRRTTRIAPGGAHSMAGDF